MKKVCIFIGGVVTGAILVVVVSMLIAGGNSTYKGITLFEKEGECISENSFKVFQVLDSGEARNSTMIFCAVFRPSPLTVFSTSACPVATIVQTSSAVNEERIIRAVLPPTPETPINDRKISRSAIPVISTC